MTISSPTNREKISALYSGRRGRFEAERDALAGRSRLISNVRLLTFLLFAACLGWLLLHPSAPKALLVVGAAVGLAVFIALVVVHDRVLRREKRAAALVELNAQALARQRRDWDQLLLSSTSAVPAGLAADLDLFGHASLRQLLGPVGTPMAEEALRDWLLQPALPDEIMARQEAVRELAPLLDWRQELSVQAGGGMPAPEPFLRWCEDEQGVLRSALRSWLPRLLAAGCLLLLTLNLAGVLRAYWLLLALLNLAVVALLGHRAAEVFEALGAREREYQRYAELIELCGAVPFRSGKLSAIQSELTSGGSSAAAALRQLDSLLGLADVRRNALISIVLQAVLLWDLQVLWLLERWRARAGVALRRRLALLAEAEALAALAGLHHDEPDWAFPELLPARPTLFVAEQLGHPLIPTERRVDNDVTVGPQGSFLLVTGSNLSGKSTLLRAVGLGAVLAGAGGPVCAKRLRLSPVRLGTSFRVQDSLEQGTSFFLAELRRLKQVVDLSRDGEAPIRPLLYLLDEILLGTNIAERQTAVRRVVGHLVEAGAIGAVATHDLTLASAEGLSAACLPVHFREQLGEGPEGVHMTFDYRLREGVAPTTNALKLLDLLGLESATYQN